MKNRNNNQKFDNNSTNQSKMQLLEGWDNALTPEEFALKAKLLLRQKMGK